MTWVAWRTQRLQLVGVLGLGLLFTLWLAVTGLGYGHSQTWKYWTEGDVFALYALPAILGLGVGAPLVAGELDRGTQRLAWTQGMSRSQWLWRKIGVGAAVVTAASGAVALLSPWWSSTVSVADNSGGFSGVKIQPNVFDVTGIVVVAYALFAFAVGSALGALVRRPGWAFAAGAPVFLVVRLVTQFDLRPHLVPPAVLTNLSGRYPAPRQPAWVLASGFVPADRTSPLPGQPWSNGLGRACTVTSTSTTALAHCLASHHIHYVVLYQPESHYWWLQGAETGVFLVLAALMLGLTVMAVRRIAA